MHFLGILLSQITMERHTERRYTQGIAGYRAEGAGTTLGELQHCELVQKVQHYNDHETTLNLRVGKNTLCNSCGLNYRNATLRVREKMSVRRLLDGDDDDDITIALDASGKRVKRIIDANPTKKAKK